MAKLKNNPVLADQLRKGLSSIRGIREVETNPVTGSILLFYESKEIVSSEARQSLLNFLQQYFPSLGQTKVQSWLDLLMR